MQDSKKRVIAKEKENDQLQKQKKRVKMETPSIFDQCFDTKTHPTWTEKEARQNVPLALLPIIARGRYRKWNNLLRYSYIIYQISNVNHRLRPRSHIINSAAFATFVDLDCQWHFVTEQKRKEEKMDGKNQKDEQEEQKKTWIIMTWKSDSDHHVKAFLQGKKILTVEYYGNKEMFIPLSIRAPEFLMFWNYSHEFMPMPGQELEIVKNSRLKASHHRIALWKTM